MKSLGITGSAALLETLAPFVPDDFVNDLAAGKSGPGRPGGFSPAQLYRASLLALLTPAHSFNLLVRLLPENKTWRTFAHLRNRRAVPTAKMLSDFRSRLGVQGLRRINQHLLAPLLDVVGRFPKTVALIDATDLPAATSAFKKSSRANTPPGTPRWVVAPLKPARAAGSSGIKTHPARMAPAVPGKGPAGPGRLVAGPGPPGRGPVSAPQPPVL
jgi:hypothetical protein